jgi:hypothetical protein
MTEGMLYFFAISINFARRTLSDGFGGIERRTSVSRTITVIKAIMETLAKPFLRIQLS